MKRIKPLPLAICIAIPLAVGFLSYLVAGGSNEYYQQLIKPPLSPPGWVFPVAWSILYVLMGVSAYIIYASDDPKSLRALTIYAVQLLVNFLWTPLFFGVQSCAGAAICLAVLWVAVVAVIASFGRISALAAWLQTPYLLWTTFALYLNVSLCLLNA